MYNVGCTTLHTYSSSPSGAPVKINDVLLDTLVKIISVRVNRVVQHQNVDATHAVVNKSTRAECSGRETGKSSDERGIFFRTRAWRASRRDREQQSRTETGESRMVPSRTWTRQIRSAAGLLLPRRDPQSGSPPEGGRKQNV